MTTKIYKVTWGSNGIANWELVPKEQIQLVGSNILELSKSLPLLNAGLSIIHVGLSVAILAKVNKIDEKVDKINAKFDLLFLDRSLDYFLEKCKVAGSLKMELLSVLENDLLNALCSLENTRDLRLPAYLAHKIYHVAEGITQLNEVIYMILHNGAISNVDQLELEEWVKEKGAEIDLLPSGGFATQSAILNIVEKYLPKKDEAFLDKLKGNSKGKQTILVRAMSDNHMLEVGHALLLAIRELRLFEKFRPRLEEKIKTSNGVIYLKAP